MWSLNTKRGYLINIDLYPGKNPKSISNDEVLYGKSTASLVSMMRELPELYTDNLFTSTFLLRVRKEGIWCTGTIRENRLPKDNTRQKNIGQGPSER